MGTGCNTYVAYGAAGTAVAFMPEVMPWPTVGYASVTPPEVDAERQAALTRALTLLEEKIGAPALAKLQAGGAYPVPSKWWPNVTYLVPKDPHERLKVVADGSVVTESCLVTTDYSLPWPDVLLHRITALEADESILFETGVLQTMKKGKWAAKLRGLFKR